MSTQAAANHGWKRLAPKERRALRALVRRLRQHYGTRIDQVILFGSRARGDASPESDFDLLIVTRTASKRSEQALLKTIETLGYKQNLVFAPHIIAKHEFVLKRKTEPFYRSIVSEGINLYTPKSERLAPGLPLLYSPPTKGFAIKDADRIQIKIRVERARQELAAANELFAKQMYPMAVSRAYYAVFMLTTAILLTRDLVRVKHSGVKAAFSEYFIRENELIRKSRTSLQNLSYRRKNGRTI